MIKLHDFAFNEAVDDAQAAFSAGEEEQGQLKAGIIAYLRACREAGVSCDATLGPCPGTAGLLRAHAAPKAPAAPGGPQEAPDGPFSPLPEPTVFPEELRPFLPNDRMKGHAWDGAPRLGDAIRCGRCGKMLSGAMVATGALPRCEADLV